MSVTIQPPTQNQANLRLTSNVQTFFLVVIYLLISTAWITVFWVLDQSPYWQHIFARLDIALWMINSVGLFFIGLSLSSYAWQTPHDKNGTTASQYFLIHLFAISILLLLFWSLYHQVLNAWWRFDDPSILHYIHEKGPLVGFYDPSQRYNFYTPLQNVSWWIDYKLFGLNPSGFYWHHLFSISIVIVLAYIVLNTFFSPVISSIIVSLFIVCVPTAQVTHYMMVRHYVEGFIFALLATWIYIQAVKRSKYCLSILGSIVYFLATLGKEIYVPLVVALACLPIGNVQTRIRLLIPYIIFAFIYTLTRIYMLGEHTFFAYTADLKSTLWQDVVNFPSTLIQIMGWTQMWQWLPMLGVMVILGILIVRKPLSTGVSFFVWLLCVLLPLMPILWRLPLLYYYLFVAGLFIAIGVGVVLCCLTVWLKRFVWQKPLIIGLFLVLLLANLLPGQVEQLRLRKTMEAEKAQGKVLLHDKSPFTVLIYDYHVATSLIYLREKVLQKTDGIAWCPKDDCFCATRYLGYTAKQYINGKWHTKTLVPENCGGVREKNLLR